jgi:hypothetical protein
MDEIIDQIFAVHGRLSREMAAEPEAGPSEAQKRRSLLEHVLRVIRNYFQAGERKDLVLNLNGLSGPRMARIQAKLEECEFDVSLEGGILTAVPQ